MGEQNEGTVNGFLVRELLTCPLKLSFLQDSGLEGYGRYPYRSAVKLQLARVLDLSFPNALRAARQVETAAAQLEEWVARPEVAICGGVLMHGVFRSRIPLLVRSGDQLTLYQVHGRLWKSARRTLGADLPDNGSLLAYLREAAYRRWLFDQRWPEWDVSIRLCFPSPDFRAAVDQLYEHVSAGFVPSEHLEGLLCEVDATRAVHELMNGDQQNFSLHPYVQGVNFSTAMEHVHSLLIGEDPPVFQVTAGCRSCDFRRSDTRTGFVGCWSRARQFPDAGEPHVYELIGQGNGHASENGYLLQKEVPVTAGISTFRELAEAGGRTISIEQRRTLQLLSVRGAALPSEWIRKGLASRLQELEYPLHFIDFEAASPPLPLFQGDGVYSEILFQFSCHTLFSDGRLTHTYWLDNSRDGSTRRAFAEALLTIPEVMNGTVIHYSPYEKQALQRLRRKLEVQEETQSLSGELDRLIRPGGKKKGARFVDLGRLVQEYYYNVRMSGGLSLKEVLPAVLQASPYLSEYCRETLPLAGHGLNLSDPVTGELANPYDLILNEECVVEDGSSAMYGWLSARGGLVDEKERGQIYADLVRYCSVDSIAMVLIWLHWLDRIRQSGKNNIEEDLSVWGEGS